MLGLLRERQPRHLVEVAGVRQWSWDGCADLPKTATRPPMRADVIIECKDQFPLRSEARRLAHRVKPEQSTLVPLGNGSTPIPIDNRTRQALKGHAPFPVRRGLWFSPGNPSG